MSKRVVVWDPMQDGEYPDGMLLEMTDPRLAARRERLVTLPISPELLDKSGCAGWIKRSFGNGFTHGVSPKFGCSVVLYAAAGYPVITWAAKLSEIGGTPVAGYLKLAGESGKPCSASGGLVSTGQLVQMANVQFGPNHEAIISGKCEAVVANDGYLALALYGSLEGVLVEWLAVAQSR